MKFDRMHFHSTINPYSQDIWVNQMLSGASGSMLSVVRLPNLELIGNCCRAIGTREVCGQLREQEIDVWEYIGAGTTMGTLRSSGLKNVEESLSRLLDLGVCDLVPTELPHSRKRVLVIEPHMDDAVLSVGGTMWLRRNECEFIVASVVGTSNYTMRYGLGNGFFDIEAVSALRRSESEHCVRFFGGKHMLLDCLEAPLRYCGGTWTKEWLERHRGSVRAFVDHRPDSDDYAVWASEIERFLRGVDAEEVWIPLGVGLHVDHELVRVACLRLITEKPEIFDGKTIRLYEDVPYAERFPEHADQVVEAMRSVGTVLKEERFDIGEAMVAKLRMMSVYRSQYRMDRFGPRVEQCARAAAPPGASNGERVFRLVERPTGSVNPGRCRVLTDEVDRLLPQLEKWRTRIGGVERVRMFLLTPAGRWRSDMEMLLELFPKVKFEVYASSLSLPETESFSHSRIVVHPFGWSLYNCLRHVLIGGFGGSPAIFLPGETTPVAAGLLRFSSKTIVALNLNLLCLAVEEIGFAKKMESESTPKNLSSD